MPKFEPDAKMRNEMTTAERDAELAEVFAEVQAQADIDEETRKRGYDNGYADAEGEIASAHEHDLADAEQRGYDAGYAAGLADGRVQALDAMTEFVDRSIAGLGQ